MACGYIIRDQARQAVYRFIICSNDTAYSEPLLYFVINRAEREGPLAGTPSTKSLSMDSVEPTGSDDAEWKQIQKKVFTRWCNKRLKVVNIEVTQLPEDFSDGIKVINLVQVISKKMVGKYSKRPRIYAQKMENVDVALKFLTQVEKIKLVNIG